MLRCKTRLISRARFGVLEEQCLGPQRHNRPAFTSGVGELDEYLHRFAVQMDARTQQKLPRYPVPCFRLGRLAVHSPHHGLGLGRLLMGCVVARCLEARKQVAAYALVVDAQGEEAKVFYAHYGFTPCQSNPMILYLPLGAN